MNYYGTSVIHKRYAVSQNCDFLPHYLSGVHRGHSAAVPYCSIMTPFAESLFLLVLYKIWSALSSRQSDPKRKKKQKQTVRLYLTNINND